MKIERKIGKDLQKVENQTKIRFLKGKAFRKEEYLKIGNEEQCSNIMKFRLNMIEAKANYKNKYKDLMCLGCKKEVESTEHIIRCEKYKELARHDLRLDEDCKQIEDLEWLIAAEKTLKRIEDVREKIAI